MSENLIVVSMASMFQNISGPSGYPCSDPSPELRTYHPKRNALFDYMLLRMQNSSAAEPFR